jgi:hypothetical protein
MRTVLWGADVLLDGGHVLEGSAREGTPHLCLELCLLGDIVDDNAALAFQLSYPQLRPHKEARGEAVPVLLVFEAIGAQVGGDEVKVQLAHRWNRVEPEATRHE